MATIPLPALSVRPQTDAPDIVGNYARLQQLKSLANNQVLQQQEIQANQQRQRASEMELEQNQAAMEDQKAFREAMSDPSMQGKTIGEIADAMASKGRMSMAGYQAAKKADIELRKSIAGMTDDQLKVAKSSDEMTQKLYDNVMGMSDEQLAQNWPTIAQQYDAIPRLPNSKMPQLDPSQPMTKQQLQQFGPMLAMGRAYQNSEMDRRKKQADVASAEAESQQKVRSNAASQLASAGSKEQYAELWGELPAKVARMFPSPEQWTPDAKDAILQTGMTAHEQATVPTDKLEMKDWLAKNPGKGPADFMRYQKTIVPAFNFNLQTGGGGITPPGTPAADVAKRFGMSPEAFDQAAERFYQTGTLPPIGRGNAAAQALNKAIMNRTAELHPNESLAAGSAEYKANAESLKKLQAMSDAVGSFENTALKNLDLFIAQANKVVDSGSPWINKPLRTISEKALGNADLPAYNAARQVAINEIAKVTSNPNLSSVLSDTARKEVENFNPANATLQQTLRVASVLKQDMANRKSSIEDQIGVIQGRLRGAQKGSGNQGGGGNTSAPLKITLPSGKTVTIGGQ